MVFLRDLSDRFSNLRDLIREMGKNRPEAVEMIASKEAEMNAAEIRVSTHAKNPGESALFMHRLSRVGCFNCGKVGNFKRECPQSQKGHVAAGVDAGSNFKNVYKKQSGERGRRGNRERRGSGNRTRKGYPRSGEITTTYFYGGDSSGDRD